MWPRHSFSRSAKYFFKRVLRLSASPHAVAAGFAVGAFTSCTPFMGFHFIISVFLSLFVGGNALAAMLGTSFGNPLTFPFIWASTFEVGSLILGNGGKSFDGENFRHGLMEGSFDILWPIVKPMIVGAVPIGFIVGVIFYFVILKLVKAYQAARHARFFERRRLAELAKAAMHIGDGEKKHEGADGEDDGDATVANAEDASRDILKVASDERKEASG